LNVAKADKIYEIAQYNKQKQIIHNMIVKFAALVDKHK